MTGSAMMTGIYIVSGFLGAGKTTFIRKLISEAFRGEKIAILENDFGDAGIDAALLGSTGVRVAEINSGCICCSLSGDFVDGMEEILGRFKPDKAVIEPSGVAKLSDVERACLDPRIAAFAEVRKKITIVDANGCKKYIENFGEFYEDQIHHADTILINRAEGPPGKPEMAGEALKAVRELNERAVIFTAPWDGLSTEEILSGGGAGRETSAHCPDCGDSNCSGEHDHAADELFDSVTLRTERVFSDGDLRDRVSDAERMTGGTILRAKGIVRGEKGYLNVQYIPGGLTIEDSPAPGGAICFIGRNLDQSELTALFCGAKPD
jgi:G3E family GTPase